MELRVRKIRQASSGASHIVIYDAEIQLTSEGVQVEILNPPEDAYPGEVDAAREAIQRGPEKVLQPRGQGAIIRVSGVVIHPVDFKSWAFERYTAEALERLLEEPPAEETI